MGIYFHNIWSLLEQFVCEQQQNNFQKQGQVKKFNPQTTRPQVNNKEKEIAKSTFISSLLPPIPAKSQKEVIEISKYFKKSDKPPQKKSYTQASSQSKLANSSSLLSVAMNTLKIKEMFLNLPNKKINIV